MNFIGKYDSIKKYKDNNYPIDVSFSDFMDDITKEHSYMGAQYLYLRDKLDPTGQIVRAGDGAFMNVIKRLKEIIPKFSKKITQKKSKSQLKINLDTELLKSLKIKSIQQDKTLSEYISEILIKEISDN